MRRARHLLIMVILVASISSASTCALGWVAMNSPEQLNKMEFLLTWWDAIQGKTDGVMTAIRNQVASGPSLLSSLPKLEREADALRPVVTDTQDLIAAIRAMRASRTFTAREIVWFEDPEGRYFEVMDLRDLGKWLSTWEAQLTKELRPLEKRLRDLELIIEALQQAKKAGVRTTKTTSAGGKPPYQPRVFEAR